MLFRFLVERDGVRSVAKATCREEILDDLGRDGVTACFRLPASLADQTDEFVLDHYRRLRFAPDTDAAPDLTLREAVGNRVAKVLDRVSALVP